MGFATIDPHSQKEHTEIHKPNLGILWISLCSFWLCESIVANPIIYRLVPSPSRFENRQCSLEETRECHKQAQYSRNIINNLNGSKSCHRFSYLPWREVVRQWIQKIGAQASSNTRKLEVVIAKYFCFTRAQIALLWRTKGGDTEFEVVLTLVGGTPRQCVATFTVE